MKRKHLRFGAFLCALTLFLGGCAYIPEEDASADVYAQYQETIATLEAELAAQREKLAQSESQYKAEIASLQAKLELLNEQNKVEMGEQSVEFRYRVENGGAVITGYSGGQDLLSIPQTLDGYPVIAIGERAFEGASFTAVILPEGITSIGWFAFFECERLINVTLPTSVSSIGYAVFDGCGELTLYCKADSYAARYAQSYGYSCVTN